MPSAFDSRPFTAACVRLTGTHLVPKSTIIKLTMVSPEPASPSSPSSRHPGWAPSACSSSSAANKKMQPGALPLGAPGLAKNPRESWRGRMVQDPETRKWGLVVLEEGDKLHVQFGYVSLCSAHTPPVSPSRRQSSKEQQGAVSRRSSQGGEKSPAGDAAVDMVRGKVSMLRSEALPTPPPTFHL